MSFKPKTDNATKTLIHDIMNLVIGGQNDGLFTGFISFSGHVSALRVRIFEIEYQPSNVETFEMVAYADKPLTVIDLKTQLTAYIDGLRKKQLQAETVNQ